MNIDKLHQEHDKQNENYLDAKAALFSKGNGEADAGKWKTLANKRLDSLVSLLSGITNEDIAAASSYISATDCLVSFFDDIVLECTLLTDRRNEIEGKLLDLVKEALGTPMEQNTRDMEAEHVACSFIEGLVMHEAPLDSRYSTMTSALMHDTNPLRLGLTFYKIFCEKYPDTVDEALMEHLHLEENVRIMLMNGNMSQVLDEVTKLFATPYNNPEKFLLLSLASFGSGLTDDAIRTLEIGLGSFPDSERLKSALESLKAGV